MANEIQLKRSSVAGKIPDAANVLVGEPVVNLADRILYTKDGTGNVILVGSNLTIQLANTSNNVSKSVSDVRVIQFDDDSGFDVVDRANGIAKVQMNSTFKTWNVYGQANLVAQGLDVVRFVEGSGITITTNALSSPQEIRFDASGGGGGNIISVNGLTGVVVLTTSNISEGSNLYFSNTRVLGALADNTVTIGNVIVTGNLYVQGDAVEFNTASLIIEDKNIVLANGAPDAATAGGAGITVSGSNASLIYSYSSNAWLFDRDVYVGNAILVSDDYFNTSNILDDADLFFSNAKVYSNVIELGYITSSELNGYATNAQLASYATTTNLALKANIVDLTTDNVIELGNLYFTNARVVSALTAGQNITIDANGRINSTATGGGGGDYGDANVYANVSLLNFLTASNLVGYATNAQLTDYVLNANLTTANVVELTNLYFTNARVYSNVQEIGYATNGNVSLKANISDLTTSNVSELSNLYFTNARVYSNVLELNYITSSSLSGYATNAQLTDYALDVDLTTDNVTELTNLYFTNARARSALSGGNGIDYNSGTGVIAIGDGADVEFKDLTITGNLLVLGQTTTINAREIAISDNMIYLNEAISFAINNVVGDGANVTYTTVTNHGAAVGEVVRVTGVNPSTYNQTSYVSIIAVTNNTITIANTTTGTYISGGNVFIKASINPDLGISGGYNDGTYHHAGVFRDATDGNWKFFEGYGPEPDANIFIDTAHPTFSLANVQAKYFIGPVIGNVSDITNHTTTELAEGSNLYFTNARVVAALSAGQSITIDANGRINSTATGGGGDYGDANVYANVVLLNYITSSSLVGYATNAQLTVYALDSDLTTANVTELTNLYFTNTRVSTAISSQTLDNATFSGNVVTTANVKAGAYIDGSDRRLIIKDQYNNIVWGE